VIGDIFLATTLTPKLSPAAEAFGEGLSEGAKTRMHRLACRRAGKTRRKWLMEAIE